MTAEDKYILKKLDIHLRPARRPMDRIIHYTLKVIRRSFSLTAAALAQWGAVIHSPNIPQSEQVLRAKLCPV